MFRRPRAEKAVATVTQRNIRHVPQLNHMSKHHCGLHGEPAIVLLHSAVELAIKLQSSNLSVPITCECTVFLAIFFCCHCSCYLWAFAAFIDGKVEKGQEMKRRRGNMIGKQ